MVNIGDRNFNEACVKQNVAGGASIQSSYIDRGSAHLSHAGLHADVRGRERRLQVGEDPVSQPAVLLGKDAAVGHPPTRHGSAATRKYEGIPVGDASPGVELRQSQQGREQEGQAAGVGEKKPFGTHGQARVDDILLLRQLPLLLLGRRQVILGKQLYLASADCLRKHVRPYRQSCGDVSIDRRRSRMRG